MKVEYAAASSSPGVVSSGFGSPSGTEKGSP